MRKMKKIIVIAVSYLIAFLASVCVSSFMVNQGKAAGAIQDAGASLPVLYVRAGGRMINEMHGYTEPVDGGYYRDTLTPVGDSKTINFYLDRYDYQIVSGSYELYNDQYNTLIESGDCTDIEKADNLQQMQILFRDSLSSNREYCLRVMLTDADGEVINYYTRIRYGSDLKVAEKMKFVLDFNEATFDKDSVIELANYLESSSTANSSDYSTVTLHSSGDMVTWGSMEPYRTSELAIRLKEINTETAAFTLSYQIESSAGELTTFYDVEEYYRLRWTSDKIYLLDFERRMEEDMSLADVSVTDGAMRIGVSDASGIDFESYGTEDQQYCYVANNDQLWFYDGTNRILTKVYAESDEHHNCSREDELGIKVIHGDPVTGDLYFVVYGYMHDGNYEGREGVLIYHFSHEDVMLEQLMFIPFEKGFAQLESGIQQLAYMNDSGEIYLMLEDTVYLIDAALGRMETAWTGLGSDNSAVSDVGVLVMTEGGEGHGGERLVVVNLNTDKKSYIEGGEQLITPLGFAGEDLIYGLIDSRLVAADSSGTVQMPISEVHIVDSNLKEVKSYQQNGSYVMGLTINDGNISLNLGRAVKNGSYTDYEDAGEDYIVRNREEDEGSIYLDAKRDEIRGLQNWLQLDTGESFVPITQTARYLDPGYDITKTYIPSDSTELCYYVYTKGRLAGTFRTIGDAIAYGNEYAGTVMTSHKQIVWQKAGRAYVRELNIDSIEKAGSGRSVNQVLLNAITGYEGWEMPGQIDNSLPLFAAMTEYLPAETVDLSGLDMTDVLHFVYRDRLVAVKIGDNQFALIIAYDENTQYVQLADPQEGDTYWLSWRTAENRFKEAGSVYYSYYD